MRDPFLIDGPTCISFSGGRTSAYMLWRVLQSHGGTLPDDAHVIFANTGKEDERTLEFVERCSKEWRVPIHWVEYDTHDRMALRWKCVDFKTASRNGEPFRALNRVKRYLPAPHARYCTINLKVEPARGLMYDLGYTEWENLVGIRYDEPKRAAKIKANPFEGQGIERRMPLFDAGVTRGDVLSFWRFNSFDLDLQSHTGYSIHGNCDLCFLKPTGQLVSLIAERPSRAVWWIEEEQWAKTITNDSASKGIRFRPNDPSYEQMARFAAEQRDMFDKDEEAIACFCGD